MNESEKTRKWIFKSVMNPVAADSYYYEELTKAGIECVVIAPSTMPSIKNEIKTDKRDAMKIARCLEQLQSGLHSYERRFGSKRRKQQILGFCLRHGFTEKLVDAQA